MIRFVLPRRIYRGGDFKDDVSYLRSPYSEATSPKSSYADLGFRLVLPYRTSPMPLPLLHGGSWLSPPRLCRSAFRDRFHLLPISADNSLGFRLVLPCRASAIHGGDIPSMRPTSSLRNCVRIGRSSKFLGLRIVAPVAIAPPSQQPKVISLISIAVCDDGSVSIHIGK